jgi:hypothetical protein
MRIHLFASILASFPLASTQSFGYPGFRHGGQGQQQDHMVIRYLLSQGPSIQRKVTNIENGVDTLTESDRPEVAAKIKEHVHAMHARIEEVRPIHMRDPLFAAIFENTESISMQIIETEKGVRVIETSDHPYVVKLIQEHAKVVSQFVKNGHSEAMKNHPVPTP